MTAKSENTIIKHWRIYAASIGLFVVVGAAIVVSRIGFRPAAAASFEATYTVHRRDLKISVTESGEIKTLESTDITSEAEEMKTIVSIVPEGTVITEEDVRNGMVLCELDSSELQEEILLQEIEFAEAEADHIEAQQACEIQEKLNESNIKKSELAVKFAILELKKFFSEDIAQQLFELEDQSDSVEGFVAELIEEMTADPNDPRWGGAALQKKRKLEADIELAAGQLEKDRNQLRGTERLFDSGYVAYSELERDRLAFSRSQTNLQKARTAIGLFSKYDFPKQSEELFTDYLESRRQLDRTRARARSKMAQVQSRLSSRKVIYLSQQDRLEKLRKELKACTIKATVPGMVIYGSSEDYWKKNTDPIEIGDGVEQGQKIITIPNYEQMSVRIGVRESWVDKIQPGQAARVIIDPFPDTVFAGEVKRVAPLPDSRSRYSDSSVRLYSTEIALDGSQGRIQPGMSARVEIVIKELEDVICVPIQAVVRDNGSKICQVIADGKVEPRTVETGDFNEAFVEILSGLDEGDVISLVPTQHSPESSHDGAESTQ